MPKVASCIMLDKEGKILILKRSKKVKSYKEMWGVVAGYIEKDEKPIDTAIKEIKEEIGFNESNYRLVKSLDPVRLIDYYEGKKFDWQIYPFLFIIEKKDKINIDWEHLEYRWVRPSELKNYRTVPHLRKIVLKIIQ